MLTIIWLEHSPKTTPASSSNPPPAPAPLISGYPQLSCPEIHDKGCDSGPFRPGVTDWSSGAVRCEQLWKLPWQIVHIAHISMINAPYWFEKHWVIIYAIYWFVCWSGWISRGGHMEILDLSRNLTFRRTIFYARDFLVSHFQRRECKKGWKMNQRRFACEVAWGI